MLALKSWCNHNYLMNLIKTIFDLLRPEVWAIYVVGLVTITVAVWQFKRNFILNKKASVFEELSKDIQKATTLVNKINIDSNAIIQHLANAANLASNNFDLSLNKTETENENEVSRRLAEIMSTVEKHSELIETIYRSYIEVLELIKKVEKTTVIGKKPSKAARYLFFAAEEQYNLVQSTTLVLQSFNVTPTLWEKPNISPETFNAFISLIQLINTQNQVLANYLEDLEVILHNNLVKSIYGKAAFNSIPTKHLTSEGLTDDRVKNSLI